MIFDFPMGGFETPTMENTSKQALLYFFTNVYTLSLLSDMGIPANFSEEIYTKLHKLLPADSPLQEEPPADLIDFDYKIFPLRAVYTQGHPAVADLSNHFLSEKKDFHWDKGKLKKTIQPADQALLIHCEVKLAEYLYHRSLLDPKEASTSREKYIGLLLLHSAIEQGEFCHAYLRNNQGFFVKKKDKSKHHDHIFLKTKDEHIRWLDQIHMMHAYGSLYQVLQDQDRYPRYYDHEQALYFCDLSMQILHVLLHQEEHIYNLKTKELAEAIPLIINTARMLGKKVEMEPFIIKLCAEVCSRELEGGKLSRERYGPKVSSLATHGRALKALVEGYKFTQLDHFHGAAKKIYRYIHGRWDREINLFTHNKRKKLKYSAKDIGSLIGGLHSLLSIETHPNNIALLEKQICAFFHSAINISGIQIAPPPIAEIPNMRSIKELDPLAAEIFCHDEQSCVFLKEFKIYPKKDKIYLYRDQYEVHHALYAALELSALTNMEQLPTKDMQKIDPPVWETGETIEDIEIIELKEE